MLFNSTIFLFAFLPLTYVGFWRLQTKRQRYAWLTFTGYLFYSFWNASFCALMAFSTLVSYSAGRGLLAWSDPRRRRICLVLPIVTDLLLLGFFKYANFAAASAKSIAGWCGLSLNVPVLDIILPVGISFYTFHTISYVVDCYRGKVVPTRNFFEFSCYVSLFAQLVAGPIVRFGQIESDLDRIDRRDWRESFNLGCSFFAIGLTKKVLLADTLAVLINPMLDSHLSLSTATAWCCMLGYSYQLYFDFSGYSDMAVGLGHLFGLRLPQNFNSPYQAVSIADFWHRWHISLSSCLRDYLYIPLGGGRGTRFAVNRNLLITMLLGGLWHGANWTFVVWGAYHGSLLIAHRRWSSLWDRMPRLVQQAGTFILVLIGWTIFRAESLPRAGSLMHSMFVWTPGSPLPWGLGAIGVLVLGGVVAHCLRNTFEIKHQWRPLPSLGLSALFALAVFMIFGGEPSPFLYFQF